MDTEKVEKYIKDQIRIKLQQFKKSGKNENQFCKFLNVDQRTFNRLISEDKSKKGPHFYTLWPIIDKLDIETDHLHEPIMIPRKKENRGPYRKRPFVFDINSSPRKYSIGTVEKRGRAIKVDNGIHSSRVKVTVDVHAYDKTVGRIRETAIQKNDNITNWEYQVDSQGIITSAHLKFETTLSGHPIIYKAFYIMDDGGQPSLRFDSAELADHANNKSYKPNAEAMKLKLDIKFWPRTVREYSQSLVEELKNENIYI